MQPPGPEATTYITQGAIALLILKEVFVFVRANTGKKNGSGTAGQIGVLHDLLVQDDDESGAKKWNVPAHVRPLKRALEQADDENEKRHLRVRGTLEDHTETLAAMRVTADMVAATMEKQTEILSDLRDLMKKKGP